MPDPTDGVLGTIGLEIETELMPVHFQIPGWSGTHDASIESPALAPRNLKGYVIETPENIQMVGMLQGNHIVLGNEYVSQVIFDDKEAEKLIRNLLRMIQRAGERPENNRAGIHVHVGWAYDLRTLKRTIQISNWLESMLYHLGGMGYAFRGVLNNSAYCRPFTKYGPPVIDSNLGTVQMTNIDALLSADSIDSFWNRYGGIRFFSPPKRYTPQRYMGVNLFSIFLHKTLEFRMFNTTLNPDYIIAVMRLCREISRLTLTYERLPDEVNSVYDVSERRVNHNVLTELLGHVDIDDETEFVLREILERSPVPKLNPLYVCTHIRDRQIEFLFKDINTVASLYPEVIHYENPGIVDIHELENQIGIGNGPRIRRPQRPEFHPDMMWGDPVPAPDIEDEEMHHRDEDDPDFDADEEERLNQLEAEQEEEREIEEQRRQLEREADERRNREEIEAAVERLRERARRDEQEGQA
jgi:hypothetical protein